jgi:phage terminase small subunit
MPPFAGPARLRPPENLGDRARAIFTDLTGSLPVAHFRVADLPLLSAFCEACALRERAAFELEQCTVLTDPKTGRQVLSPWLSVYTGTVKAMGALAPRLRLGPMARAKQQSKKEPPALSYYDRMRNEPGWDKFDP